MKTENYIPTIGLEVHAELKTKTKMFCNSANAPFEAAPNTHVCPVCLGYPGTLPVINKEAVRQVLRVGVALKGKLADYTEFDRKNYFYPDIPKGYQISQYKHPLVEGGELAGVKITRIHLEEDTAKSTHPEGQASGAGDKGSLIDFNRAGVPLMELVTEPVIHDAEAASRFAKELQLLLISLGASEANMERGEMRVEANISIAKSKGLMTNDKLGTKVEVKNLNSFKAVEKAIRYEIERHISVLERGEKVVQETRGWDEDKETTFSQRVKEESHDYRYFPDPDLPKLMTSEIPEFGGAELKKSLPELPWDKRARLIGLGLTPEHAEIYVTQPEWGSFFEEVASIIKSPEALVLASNFITSELKAPISAIEFSETVKMFASEELSSKGAKEVLRILKDTGGHAREISTKNNLIQISDEAELKNIADEVIKANPGVKLVDFLVGQGVKMSKGKANPRILKKIFSELV